MSDLLQVSDLEKTKLHNTFHVEAVTGKEGGLAGGADIDYATNAVTGQVQKTLPKILDDIDWSYVGLFADVVTFTKSTDFAVDNSGIQWIYTGGYPFTTEPATVPSEPLYQVVHVRDHNSLSNRNAAGAHESSSISFDNTSSKIASSTSQDAIEELSLSKNTIEYDFGATICKREDGVIVHIGDSITVGTGASSPHKTYGNMLCRSFFNAIDNGDETDRGYMYETQLSLYTEFVRGYLSATGFTPAFVNYGPADNAFAIPDGGQINITNKEVVYGDIFYDGDASTATSIEIYRESTLVATKSVTAGISSTGLTALKGGEYISTTDTFSFKAIGGDLIVFGISALRQSSRSGLFFVSAKSGTDTTYHLSKAPTLISAVNLLAPSRIKTVMLSIGSNDIYNTGTDKAPSDFITSLTNLVDAYIAGFGSGTKIVLQVPLQSDENIYPANLGSYVDYVKALVEYADANSYQLIRLDECGVSKDNDLLADGLHPNSLGHLSLAQFYCKSLGLSFNPWIFKRLTTDTKPISKTVSVTYNSTWESFAPSTPVIAIKYGRVVTLDGLAASNASVSTTMLTIPVGYKPTITQYVPVVTSAGLSYVVISSSGTVVINGTIPAWVSLQGISFIFGNN